MTTPITDLTPLTVTRGTELIAIEDQDGAAGSMTPGMLDQTRLGFYNVLDYGADTAAADNSAAFQAAIDAAVANTGGTVYVPPIGNFNFTSGIQMYGNGVWLVGATGWANEGNQNTLSFNMTSNESCITIGEIAGDGRFLTGGGIEKLSLRQSNASAVDSHVILFGEQKGSGLVAHSVSGTRGLYRCLRISQASKDSSGIACFGGNMLENIFTQFDIFHPTPDKDTASGRPLIDLNGTDRPNANIFEMGRLNNPANFAIRIQGVSNGGGKPNGNVFRSLDIENAYHGTMHIKGTQHTRCENVCVYDLTQASTEDCFKLTTVDTYGGETSFSQNTTFINCSMVLVSPTWEGSKCFMRIQGDHCFIANCGQMYNDTINATIILESGAHGHVFDQQNVNIDNQGTGISVYSSWGRFASQISSSVAEGLESGNLQTDVTELAQRVAALEQPEP